jgi:hypothetical protein
VDVGAWCGCIGRAKDKVASAKRIAIHLYFILRAL